MAEYLRETINSVINETNREYFLPDIQRSFVWKEEQIYKLFDSLMRGYPISTFLFWELSKEKIKKIEEDYDFKLKMFKFVNSNKSKSEEELNRKEGKYSLVLDGQQRLTSLYICLRGNWVIRRKIKELYFNVLSGENENEEGVLFEFKFFEKDNGLFFTEKETEKIDKIWINVKRIFEIESGKTAKIRKFIEEIIDKNEELKDSENKIFDKVNDLYTVLTSDLIINYYPEKEDNYDRVLDIFIRTNAGGTKLSYSDLLFSKIKLKWNKAREQFASLLEDLNDNNFDFDVDFILKTCLVIFSEKTEEVKYRIKNFKDSKIEKIKNNWQKISESIKSTCDLMESFGIKHKKLLPSYNAIIPVIYFIYQNDIRGAGEFERGISTSEKGKMKKWIYPILLSGVFGGQSDNILYKTKETINNFENDSFPIEELNRSIKSIKSFDISKEFLDKIKYNSTNSHLLLSLLYPELNFKPKYDGNIPQQDHIFSKKELRSLFKKEEIDNIGNIRYIGANENNWKKDTSFKDWIKNISQEEREKHLIPEGNWNTNNYKEFIKKRREKIFEKIKEIFNPA